MTTFDNPDEFTRDDAILLQVERVNQSIEGVASTIDKINEILDRVEANQKQLVEDIRVALND